MHDHSLPTVREQEWKPRTPVVLGQLAGRDPIRTRWRRLHNWCHTVNTLCHFWCGMFWQTSKFCHRNLQFTPQDTIILSGLVVTFGACHHLCPSKKTCLHLHSLLRAFYFAKSSVNFAFIANGCFRFSSLMFFDIFTCFATSPDVLTFISWCKVSFLSE